MEDGTTALDLLTDLIQLTNAGSDAELDALAWQARDAHVAEIQTLKIEIQALRAECAKMRFVELRRRAMAKESGYDGYGVKIAMMEEVKQ